MTSPFTPFSILDPALAGKQIEDALAHGGACEGTDWSAGVTRYRKQGRISIHHEHQHNDSAIPGHPPS
jgi:hypothetical protein